MRALKLFAPFIIAPLLAIAGFFIWRYSSDLVPGAPEEAVLFSDGQPLTLPTPSLKDATPGAREAFAFTTDHLEFPQEWWYFNAHLVDGQNRRYGLMVALLKTGQVLASLTLVQHGLHFGMQENGLIELLPDTLTVVGPTSVLRQVDVNRYEYEFHFKHQLADIELRMTANKAPLPVGGEGLIDMGDGGESYYYSLTNLSVTGVGRIRNAKVTLTGKGWMDHQWGDWNDRDFDQWHWYSIQLADNTEIMIFEFRRHSRLMAPLCDIVFPDGTTRHGLTFKIKPLKTWISPRTGRSWTVGWRIRIPGVRADLRVVPDLENQEVTDALWEGVCTVKGHIDDKPVRGLAFYEARHRTW